MKVSSASARSAAARMDIENAAQDARTMFFMTCPPLAGQLQVGDLRVRATGAAKNHARSGRAASRAGTLSGYSDAASRRGIEDVRMPGFRRKGELVPGAQVRPSVRHDREGDIGDPDHEFRLRTRRLDDDHLGADAAAAVDPDVFRAEAVLHGLAVGATRRFDRPAMSQ